MTAPAKTVRSSKHRYLSERELIAVIKHGASTMPVDQRVAALEMLMAKMIAGHNAHVRDFEKRDRERALWIKRLCLDTLALQDEVFGLQGWTEAGHDALYELHRQVDAAEKRPSRKTQKGQQRRRGAENIIVLAAHRKNEPSTLVE